MGSLVGDLLHREQSVGEIRGLRRLAQLIFDRKLELENQLNPKKEIDEDV